MIDSEYIFCTVFKTSINFVISTGILSTLIFPISNECIFSIKNSVLLFFFIFLLSFAISIVFVIVEILISDFVFKNIIKFKNCISLSMSSGFGK